MKSRTPLAIISSMPLETTSDRSDVWTSSYGSLRCSISIPRPENDLLYSSTFPGFDVMTLSLMCTSPCS